MLSVRDLIFDAYSGLTHRLGFGQQSKLSRPWAGEIHQRRIAAYIELEATYRNQARNRLSRDISDADRAKLREYGDAALLVDTTRSALTGDDVSIVVDGADASLELAEPDADGEVPPGSPTTEDVELAHARAERLEWLEDWADHERFALKVHETELDTVKLGDGVYALEIDYELGRVRLRIFDATNYFPDLDPRRPEDEFPRRIDIAWEYEAESGGSTQQYLHRITWQLGPIRPLTDPDGIPLLDEDDNLILRDGDQVDDAGRIVRTYPYSDRPSPWTCYKTEATWTLDAIEGRTLTEFDVNKADVDMTTDADGSPVLVRDLDLMIDFIPVIHVPNTPAVKAHYGEALTTRVTQVLDDLYGLDTDVKKAADIACTPVIGVTGQQPGDAVLRPGLMIGLGQNGRMDVLDMAAPLEQGRETVEYLLRRLVTNVRLTDEALGRVKASDVASGILFALTFGPMRSLIAEMRLSRDEKYPLMLKFLQRMAITAEFLEGEVHPAAAAWGSYLPTDQEVVIARAIRLFEAHLISRQTALGELVREGILDVNVIEEVTRAEHEDFERAEILYQALGANPAAVVAVAELLGVAIPDEVETNEEVEEDTINPVLDLSR